MAIGLWDHDRKEYRMKIEEVKKNMLEIAEILNKFPENLQEKAFDVMVYQL